MSTTAPAIPSVGRDGQSGRWRRLTRRRTDRPELDARTLGRRACVFLATSVVLVVVTGFLGPSATQPRLPGKHAGLPPYSADTNVSAWIISALILALLCLGAWGTHLALRAVHRGWRPNLRRFGAVSALGVVAVSLVPPMGSGDILMYAAYGRIASHYGGDVYSLTPDEISRFTYDAVTAVVERPWQNTPSVYGPIATWSQQFAGWLGGDSVHATVSVLQATNALTYIVSGLLVLLLAGRDPGDRTRALLCGLANPVLIWAVVAGAHNDAQAAMFGLMALIVLRRTPLGAGVLLGLAGAVKLSLGFYGLAFLWALRGTKRGMGELVLGAGVTLVGLYLTTSRHAFDQVLTASKFMSTGTPAKMLYAPLTLVFSDGVARRVLSGIAWIVLVILVAMLMQVMPRVLGRRAAMDQLDGPVDGVVAAPVARRWNGDRVRADAVRACVALTFVWLVTALYSLPWYDVVTWLPLAGLAASRLDRLLLIRTTAMAIGYIPGRDSPDAPVGQVLLFITDRLRDTVVPVIQTVVLVLLVRWCLQRGAAGPTAMYRALREHRFTALFGRVR